jgi:hypothetical protein
MRGLTDRPFFCRRFRHLAPEQRSLAPVTASVYRYGQTTIDVPDVATCLFGNLAPPRSLARLAGLRRPHAILAGHVQCFGSWRSGWGPRRGFRSKGEWGAKCGLAGEKQATCLTPTARALPNCNASRAFQRSGPALSEAICCDSVATSPSCDPGNPRKLPRLRWFCRRLDKAHPALLPPHALPKPISNLEGSFLPSVRIKRLHPVAKARKTNSKVRILGDVPLVPGSYCDQGSNTKVVRGAAEGNR